MLDKANIISDCKGNEYKPQLFDTSMADLKPTYRYVWESNEVIILITALVTP